MSGSNEEKMNNIFETLKQKFSKPKTWATFLMASLMMLVAQTPGGAAQAESRPVFNDLPEEKSFFRIGEPQSDVYLDPVSLPSVKEGDKLVFRVFYHNDTPDTIAHNTKIKVDLPLQPATQLVSTAHIWADGVAEAVDSATLNLPTEFGLEYVPGTTRQWTYLNQQLVPLPDGVMATGVNLGDVKACHEQWGFIYFGVRLVTPPKAPQNPGLQITKSVDRTTARTGDVLNYSVTVSNPGDATTTNIVLFDTFPNKAWYTPESVKRDGVSVSDSEIYNMFSTGVNIGSLASGASTTFFFQGKVKADLAVGSHLLTNVAWVNADGGLSARAEVNTTVNVEEPIIPGQPQLTLDKQVNRATANPADTLNYTIILANSGNAAAQDVRLADVLPNRVTYTVGSLSRDGQIISNSDIFSTGLVLGNLAAGASTTLRFSTQVNSGLAPGTYNLVNTANATASGGLSANDSVTTIVTVAQQPGQPQLNLSKSAFNVTRNVDATAVTSQAGDVIRYTLNVSNTGTAVAAGYVASDDLADILEYATVTDTGGGNLQANTISWSGADIAVNQTISRTFQVQLRTPVPSGGNYVMTNVFGNTINVNVLAPATPRAVAPILSISKFVRNATKGEVDFNQKNEAFAGDILEYRVVVTNTGTVNAQRVQLSDAIPANTSFVAGSGRLQNSSGTSTLTSDPASGWLAIGDLAPAQAALLTFQVTTDANLASGNLLTNTAYTTAQDFAPISAAAYTTIKARPTVVQAPTSETPAPEVKGVTTQGELPKTGPTVSLGFLPFLGLMVSAIGYRRTSRELGLRFLYSR